MTWGKGLDEVNRLLAEGSLESIRGASADGHALLDSAARLLKSAEREASINPEAAFVLGYDSARKACAALLAQQGLRTRSSGHHVTTEKVVRAQFGGPFESFGALRRRRIEIEYPRFPGDDVTEHEVRQALTKVAAIHSSAAQLLDQMTLFTVER